MSCHDSDGRQVNSGLTGPGFKPWPRQEKVKSIFSSFWLVALEPMRSTFKYLAYASNTGDIK